MTLVRALGSEDSPSEQPEGGILVDPLVAGRPIRLEIARGRFFVTSAIRGLERLGRDAVQVVTANSVYRVERAGVAAPGRSKGRSLKRLRLRALRRLARRVSSEHPRLIQAPVSPESTQLLGPVEEGTRYVAVLSESGDAGDPFAPGTRVRIARTRRNRRKDLGFGYVLDPIEIGQPVRCSTDDGRVFATTAVGAVLEAGPRAIDFETANTVYHFERVAKDR